VPSSVSELTRYPVIFFDGYCGLCDRFISRVIAHPRAGRLRFAPQQGQTFAALVEEGIVAKGLDSIVVFDPVGGIIFTRSDATIFILSQLGGLDGVLAGLLRWCPRMVRDGGYRLIAACRFMFFGRRDTCRLPSPEERTLFLP